MASGRQVRLLRRGPDIWNKWRKEHRGVTVDLSGTSFRREYLGEVDLSGAILRESDLLETTLSGADLSGADLSWAVLDEAYLDGADLSNANFHRAALCETRFCNVHARMGSPGAARNGAKLYRAQFLGTDLSGAYLNWTDLREAIFDHAILSGADLSEANLSEAYLVKSSLHGADLRGTNLSGLTAGWTDFGDVDFRGCVGLDSVKHEGPSSIGIDTVFKSGGKIPEVFLRGAGVPDEFITYMKSLAGKAIEFPSCFISYSSKDQDFADRLHADLQDKNVRCWFAPEDMKIGDKIWDRLDRSIRVHDKLLLILSKNSIGSERVEDEVTTAFEEERKRGKTVLFPVRLDDAIFETCEPWAAKVRQRHIGEFSNWKDHDAHKRAFDRLLRDLKAETPVMPVKDA